METERRQAEDKTSGHRRRREFLHRLVGGLAAAAGLLRTSSAAAAPAGAARTVLVFGDSLSAGLGMAREQSWPALLAEALDRRGGSPAWQLVNASISGETTHGGLARLPATLDRVSPAVVILELGGNDALRGLPISDSRRNLDAMARLVTARHARLLVVGIALPPNFGDDYAGEFAQMFSDVAKAHHAALLPNLVESLGTGREAFQADGIHPLARVQPQLMTSVLQRLEPLLGAR